MITTNTFANATLQRYESFPTEFRLVDTATERTIYHGWAESEESESLTVGISKGEAWGGFPEPPEITEEEQNKIDFSY